MSPALWRVAHSYAEHLAATRTLTENPDLSAVVSRVCPSWTAIGENSAYVDGGSHRLMRAYMHSRPHRINILNRHYTEVGIATVRVRRHGTVRQWDVMDFGNHCR
jgi:uncharacterized protein YkwD